ncbi:uncharacterized protein N7496_005524 [Penicillium cataractarum]|uniref:Alcohol dehydrogenase-like C-terminal domain-containing protein n=1 Tax=Penicillium cataractarum TaxID=2100454 RepID=A0A9W9VFZ8_9EURO|nr:uncharacterized protein N7496_005524 [Penicillium cataractarum]KAJ5378115.1 hypothetical protein N7496_005524 [Penicillium cataractarum]
MDSAPQETDPASTTMKVTGMKVARITERGLPPTIMNAAIKPPTPEKLQVRVLAVGISQQVRNRVDEDHPSSRFYMLPFDPTVDGVVQDEATGDLYYVLPRGPRLLAERLNIPKHEILKLPPNTDPVKIAGLTGAWLPTWALLMGCSGHKVLIVGATTCNGRVGAQIARYLGASEVIGLADDEAALATVHGLTTRALLGNPVDIPKFKGIKFVVDFIGGEAGAEVLDQINQGPLICELKYLPAWGPRGGDPFVVDVNLVIRRRMRVIDPALSVWHLTAPQNVGKLRFAIQMMSMIKVPFDIVAKPMAEVAEVWNHEYFKDLKQVLVLVPSERKVQGDVQLFNNKRRAVGQLTEQPAMNKKRA